jgi:hypothetical protein
MTYAIQMGSGGIIYIPSILKIGTGIQVTLRFWLSNLNVCNVGITDKTI